MKYSLRSLMIVALVLPPFIGVAVWLLWHAPDFTWLAIAGAIWLWAFLVTWGRP
jgi:hypothetical protein